MGIVKPSRGNISTFLHACSKICVFVIIHIKVIWEKECDAKIIIKIIHQTLNIFLQAISTRWQNLKTLVPKFCVRWEKNLNINEVKCAKHYDIYMKGFCFSSCNERNKGTNHQTWDREEMRLKVILWKWVSFFSSKVMPRDMWMVHTNSM